MRARTLQETEQFPSLRACCITEEECEAIRQLRHDLSQGKNWYTSLLDAIRLWDRVEEEHGDRVYRYLIGNEAFDWLVLAERLLHAVDGLVPNESIEDLIFHGKAPTKLTEDEFRERIGAGKYRAHLNYLYGITVEEALILSVERDVHKEQNARGYKLDPSTYEDVYQRIYGATQLELLQRFREERALLESNEISLTELKEFTYWLFKYRLRRSHKARIASDTRRGLDELQRQRTLLGEKNQELDQEPINYIEAEAFLCPGD